MTATPPGSFACPNCVQHQSDAAYWQAQANAAERRAADNLRLARERIEALDELQQTQRELRQALTCIAEELQAIARQHPDAHQAVMHVINQIV